MSQEIVAPAPDLPLAAAEGRGRLPWEIPVLAAAVTLTAIGGSWDISWHETIGRDSFWTPAHVAIYLGGATSGFVAGWLALRATFFGSVAERAASVGLWGGRAPLGAWLAIWGAAAMLTSAPFDNWWHNAYGLDVKILSPPHVLLFLGIIAIRIGVWLLALREQNRADAPRFAAGLFCYIGGLTQGVLAGLFLLEFWPNREHGRPYFLIACASLPLVLSAVNRASRLRWGATLAALADMLFVCSMIWVLQRFRAEPRLGPIYNPVTHMVPPPFPQWAVIPAIAMDIVKEKFRGKSWRSDAGFAVFTAAAFLLLFLPFQWYFSNFLLSPASDNWFFAGHRMWSYASFPGPRWNLFWGVPNGWTVGTVVPAFCLAAASSFCGARWGTWMTRVRR